MDKGFKIISFAELRKMGITQMQPRPLVVFVNRRTAFEPRKDLLESTQGGNWGLHEYLRRFKGEPDAMVRALKGCQYDLRYRHMITNSSDAMKQLREIASESRRRPVLMVKDKDRPDAEILVSIMKVFLNDGVWT